MPAYVTLPGTSGNYFDTPDLNLLTGDNAHAHQSVGQWDAGSGGMTVTGANDDVNGKWNTASNVLKYVEGTAATNRLLRMGGQAGFAGSTVYSMGAWVYSVDQDVKITAFLRWMSSAIVQLGTAFSSPISVPANTWTWVSVENKTSHASTTHLGLYLQYNSLDPSGDIPIGYTSYVSGVAVYQSATATAFTPTLRITNDLEIEWKVALDDYTPTATNTIADCLNSNDGYRIRHTTGDLIEIAYGNGSSTRAQTSSATGLTDGTAHVFKVTVDQSTGAVIYYIDGVQHDTDTMTTGAGAPSINDLVIGANAAASANWTDGDIYYVIVRDGIDGPVVARFDADDWVGV